MWFSFATSVILFVVHEAVHPFTPRMRPAPNMRYIFYRIVNCTPFVGFEWLKFGDERYRKSPVNRKLIDWLMDHQEIRDQLWKKMLDEEQNWQVGVGITLFVTAPTNHRQHPGRTWAPLLAYARQCLLATDVYVMYQIPIRTKSWQVSRTSIDSKGSAYFTWLCRLSDLLYS